MLRKRELELRKEVVGWGYGKGPLVSCPANLVEGSQGLHIDN
jgi:hypothetical protein